jgi:hypothetical protein
MCTVVSKSTTLSLVVMMAATLGLVGVVGGQAQPNYDPPQPSSEFGTPEATAKIAAKAGFLDVVGVKLGMSPKDALAAAKAHNAALGLEPKAKLEYEALLIETGGTVLSLKDRSSVRAKSVRQRLTGISE